MFFKSILALAVVATSVLAQTTGFGSNSTIDPSSVDLTERSSWCVSQMNTCGTLCSGEANPNDCDENTLTFHCICTANNSAPGLQYYTGTLPTFICEQNFKICINDTVGVAASQAKCKQDEKANCGQINPTDFQSASSSSSSAASTASPTSAGASGSGATTPSSSSSTGAAATMLALGGEYGAGMVAAGVAAAFGLMV